MSIEIVFYLIDILVRGKEIFILICFSYSALSVLVIFKEDEIEGKKNYFRMTFKYFLVLALITFMIPSEKTMYLMISSHYLKQSDLPKQIEIAIEKKLDEIIKDK